MEDQIRKKGDESPNMNKKFSSEATIAFHKGSSFEKVMRKCKKELEMNKLRQLLSV